MKVACAALSLTAAGRMFIFLFWRGGGGGGGAAHPAGGCCRIWTPQAHRDSTTSPPHSGAALVKGLAPHPHEIVITKQRFSAFMATELDLVLRWGVERAWVLQGRGAGTRALLPPWSCPACTPLGPCRLARGSVSCARNPNSAASHPVSLAPRNSLPSPLFSGAWACDSCPWWGCRPPTASGPRPLMQWPWDTTPSWSFETPPPRSRRPCRTPTCTTCAGSAWPHPRWRNGPSDSLRLWQPRKPSESPRHKRQPSARRSDRESSDFAS